MKYTPYHEIRDTEKLAQLIASMQTDGWLGAPLIADGDQLITGAHRYMAAQVAGIDAPVMDIRDVYPDWETLHAAFDYPTADERDYARALEGIPEDVRDAYGIDAH